MVTATAIAPAPALRIPVSASLSPQWRASSPSAGIPAASSRRRTAALVSTSGRNSPLQKVLSADAAAGVTGGRNNRRNAPRVTANARPRSVVAAAAEAAGLPASLPEALLFDCDGVLVDTERDGHRVSFNQAFEEKGLGVTWDVPLYGELLKIGGGKERMTHYFDGVGWPAAAPTDATERAAFVAGLHKSKTALFMELVETGALPLRPGVARLIDEALAAGVQVAVCSTSNEKAVGAIVRVMLGEERAQHMRIFAGDVVPKKKPDPAIYNLAASTLNLNPARCVVIEDSHIGLTAAKAAGMTCVVTKSGYTADEDFSAADAVFDAIGDSPADGFDLACVASLLKSHN
ncbi:hypothetical protein CLOM_g18963 [Closterium sp. NIES-68]|nr:hypothetical protein CLOM_g18963 [Closterium sp. NIES-68]GJP78382.1 hypothetical protein CLOP_g8688 [Closterium sp. NIES-67]